MPLIVGIAGGSGSGKTTIARALVARIGADSVAYLPHDAYYKPLAEMPVIDGEIINFDHPDALRTPLLIEHIRQLKRNQPANIPIYDFSTHSRTDKSQIMSPCPVIIVEGILIFADAGLRSLMDVKIFVDTDADIRLLRRVTRDTEERGRSLETVLYQYTACVRPMHDQFVEANKRYADLIVPEGGFNETAISVLADHIRNQIH